MTSHTVYNGSEGIAPQRPRPREPAIFERARLQREWQALNRRFLGEVLPPIDIFWSSRLTASLGVFVSNSIPRPRRTAVRTSRILTARCIRLSLPLFRALSADPDLAAQELRRTLAHEMIHQWQFDVLQRRPDHGRDFHTMMEKLGREGMRVSVYHSWSGAVESLARFHWCCTQCGQIYRRHRRTIHPRRHRCGLCRGLLKQLGLTGTAHLREIHDPPVQLRLPIELISERGEPIQTGLHRPR